MTLEITNCSNCPFSFFYDMCVGYGCRIDEQKRDIKESKKNNLPIHPNWCPLKNNEEGITIKIKK